MTKDYITLGKAVSVMAWLFYICVKNCGNL